MRRSSHPTAVVVVGVLLASCGSPRQQAQSTTQEVAWHRDSAALADSFTVLLGTPEKGGRNPAAVDADVKPFLFDLRRAGAPASAATLAHIARRYAQISTALPTFDNLRGNDVDARHDWSAAIGLSDPGENADDVVQVVQADVSLDGGAIVRQGYDTTLGGVASAARCDAQGPVIAYNPKMLAGLTAGSVRFLQEHELAHFALAHVDCGRTPVVDPRYTERAADCWAVGRLEGSGLAAVAAIGAASQFFKSLHEPEELPHYESSDRRAEYIGRFCQ